MRSIKARYQNIQDKNINLGEYICLAKAVMYKKFSRKSILKSFNEIMPKEDYLKSERKELVNHLESLAKLTEGV